MPPTPRPQFVNRLTLLRMRIPRVSLRRVHVEAPAAQLLERRADRKLPDIRSSRSYVYSVPLFLAIVGASTLAIFNYQKSSSSVVTSTLYALRVHSKARELLGDEIQYKSKFPWIRGELNQLHGIIDISYDVKGKKGSGTMHFKSTRKSRMGYFDTERWSLIMDDGRTLELLDDQVADPFPQEPSA